MPQLPSRSRAFAIAAVLVSSLAPAAPYAAQQKPVPTSDPLVRMHDAVDALTRKVWPSVVLAVGVDHEPRSGRLLRAPGQRD